MKKMKKIIALLIAMVLVLGMSATVFAADAPKGSIKVTGAQTDPQAATTKYEAYKIFDMTTDGKTDASGKYTAVAYTINSAWTNFFVGGPGASYIVDSDTTPASLNQIVINGATKYINITDANVKAFAKAAYEYAMTTPVAATASQDVNKGATEVTFSDLELGYYMVYPVGASINIDDYTSIVSITSTNPNAEIAQKAKYPTLQKTADDISVEVGQKVTYTLKSSVPDTTGYSKYEMVFADTTTAGLTFDGADSIVVTIGTATLAAADYSIDTSAPDFKVTIDMLKTVDNKKVAKYTYGDEIKITYTATVNENAVTKIDENHATLTYNNNPKDDESTGTTPPVEVPTFSSKIIINKVDGADEKTPLSGAKFVLRAKEIGTVTGDSHETDLAAGKYYFYDETAKDVKWVTVASEKAEDLANDSTITVVTTNDDGVANFDGLENGTYELIEVEAPAGYNLLTTPVEVVVNGNDAEEASLSYTEKIKNNSGTELPSTGGIGTTIFYIVGAILVIGAGVLLVTRRRMNAK